MELEEYFNFFSPNDIRLNTCCKRIDCRGAMHCAPTHYVLEQKSLHGINQNRHISDSFILNAAMSIGETI